MIVQIGSIVVMHMKKFQVSDWLHLYIHIYKRTKHRYPEARQIHLDTCMLVDSVRITMS